MNENHLIIILNVTYKLCFQSPSQVLRINDSSPSSSDDEECSSGALNVKPSSSSRNKVQTNTGSLCNQLRRKLSRHSAKVEPFFNETIAKSDSTATITGASSAGSLFRKGITAPISCKSSFSDDEKKQLMSGASVEEEEDCVPVIAQEERPVLSEISDSGSDEGRMTDELMKGNISGM